MGQPIVVVEKPSTTNPGMVRFETNRAITGMGHERYVAGTDVRGDRPPDELARRLLARGGIEMVHINGSVVTVDLAKGSTSDGLKQVIEDLYIFYPETDETDETDDAAAEGDEVTDADVQQVEGDAPTTDQTPVGATPSDPPADTAGDPPAV